MAGVHRSNELRPHDAGESVGLELHVWEAMTHGIFFNAPEEKELYNEHIEFMLSHLGSE